MKGSNVLYAEAKHGKKKHNAGSPDVWRWRAFLQAVGEEDCINDELKSDIKTFLRSGNATFQRFLVCFYFKETSASLMKFEYTTSRMGFRASSWSRSRPRRASATTWR